MTYIVGTTLNEELSKGSDPSDNTDGAEGRPESLEGFDLGDGYMGHLQPHHTPETSHTQGHTLRGYAQTCSV